MAKKVKKLLQFEASTIKAVNKHRRKQKRELKLKDLKPFQVTVEELINIGLNFEE